MLAAFFSFDHPKPFALDLGARGCTAHHAETVVDEPDHVIQEAFAVLAFLEPGFDFLYRFMSGPRCACLDYIAMKQQLTRQSPTCSCPAVNTFGRPFFLFVSGGA